MNSITMLPEFPHTCGVDPMELPPVAVCPAEFPHTCGVDPWATHRPLPAAREFPHTCGVDPVCAGHSVC